MKKKEIDEIVALVARKFRTLGGGKGGSSPIAAALKDSPLAFNHGVSVEEVVRFVVEKE